MTSMLGPLAWCLGAAPAQQLPAESPREEDPTMEDEAVLLEPEQMFPNVGPVAGFRPIADGLRVRTSRGDLMINVRPGTQVFTNMPNPPRFVALAEPMAAILGRARVSC